MLLFQKSKSKVSSRLQIRLKEVRDGVLILPNNQYRTIIETSSVNFELKSEAEQDSLIDNFQNFLNALPAEIQVLIRVREMDIKGYIEKMQKWKDKEKEQIYKQQIDDYCNFIQNLVSGNKILSRRFYIILPFPNPDNASDFTLIKKQIKVTQEIIIKGLEKLGMKAKVLETLEVLELFYSFYNPSLHKNQMLKQVTLENMAKSLYA